MLHMSYLWFSTSQDGGQEQEAKEPGPARHAGGNRWRSRRGGWLSVGPRRGREEDSEVGAASSRTKSASLDSLLRPARRALCHMRSSNGRASQNKKSSSPQAQHVPTRPVKSSKTIGADTVRRKQELKRTLCVLVMAGAGLAWRPRDQQTKHTPRDQQTKQGTSKSWSPHDFGQFLCSNFLWSYGNGLVCPFCRVFIFPARKKRKEDNALKSVALSPVVCSLLEN